MSSRISKGTLPKRAALYLIVPTHSVPARRRCSGLRVRLKWDDGLVATDTPDAVSGYPAERVGEALPQIILM
jgi:hypothetical protein